jgi:hypothetical protein
MPENTLCVNKIRYIENLSKELEGTPISNEFHACIKKQSNKIEKEGIRQNFELYHGYPNMNDHAENNENENSLQRYVALRCRVSVNRHNHLFFHITVFQSTTTRIQTHHSRGYSPISFLFFLSRFATST